MCGRIKRICSTAAFPNFRSFLFKGKCPLARRQLLAHARAWLQDPRGLGTRGSSCKLLHTSKDTRSLAKNTRRQASYTQTCQKRQTVLCFMILIQLHPSLHIASRHSINAQESFLWDQTSYKSRNLLFCIFQESNEILVRIHELLLSCLKFEVKLLPSFEIVPRF